MRHFRPEHFDQSKPLSEDSAEFGADPLREALAAAEAELAESRRQLASVLQSLSGIFYRCEVEAPWRMSFISDGVELLTGYQSSELERTGWASLIVPEDMPEVQEKVRLALEERRSFSLAYRIAHKSGEERWVGEQGHATYNEAGVPAFLEGVITDITAQKQAEGLKQNIARRWRKTLDTIPQMVWSMKPDGSEEFFNQQWTEFTGRKIGRAFDLDRIDVVHPEDRDAAAKAWEHSLSSGEAYEAEYRICHASGEYRWVLSRGFPERDASGAVARWYGTCTDVHERVSAQKDLLANQKFVRRLIGASPDSLILLDAEGRILFANDVARQDLGSEDQSDLLGQTWLELIAPAVRREAEAALERAHSDSASKQFAVKLTGSGETWWDVVVTPLLDSGPAGFLITSRDITHQKRAEYQAKWSADHDPLTRLANRTVLQQRLDEMIAQDGPGASRFALVLLDVDNFKRTNDTLGHDAGDALLCAFADRLATCVGPKDLVARLGGDEFAILLASTGSEAELVRFSEKMSETFKEPFVHEGKMLECRASSGASIYPTHGRTKSDLLKHADLALYVAKASGRGVLKVFERSMRSEMHRRNKMLSIGRRALNEDLILPFYQPKVDLNSGKVLGFEALLRWNDPKKGLQMPDTMAACFHDMRLAADISDRMIEAVIADARGWLNKGVEFGHISINAAAAEFRRGEFAERLVEQLRSAGIPNECIQIEVTETVFLGRGADYVEHALKTMSASGIKVALDDFGTGYASLSHLKQFPVDVIKIDRSFVKNLKEDSEDRAIVDAVISLGRSLSIEVVAEGIETRGQHDFLRKLGCDVGQGYLYGQAAPASEVAEIIAVRSLAG